MKLFNITTNQAVFSEKPIDGLIYTIMHISKWSTEDVIGYQDHNCYEFKYDYTTNTMNKQIKKYTNSEKKQINACNCAHITSIQQQINQYKYCNDHVPNFVNNVCKHCSFEYNELDVYEEEDIKDSDNGSVQNEPTDIKIKKLLQYINYLDNKMKSMNMIIQIQEELIKTLSLT